MCGFYAPSWSFSTGCSLASQLRNRRVQLRSWELPVWGDLNCLVDIGPSLFRVRGLLSANSLPGTPFSYLRACATIHLCLCSALLQDGHTWLMVLITEYIAQDPSHESWISFCFLGFGVGVFVAPFPRL